MVNFPKVTLPINKYKGKFVVFEGLDGSGQSTQADDRLRTILLRFFFKLANLIFEIAAIYLDFLSFLCYYGSNTDDVIRKFFKRTVNCVKTNFLHLVSDLMF